MCCAEWWISSDSADGECLYPENKHKETKVNGTPLVVLSESTPDAANC